MTRSKSFFISPLISKKISEPKGMFGRPTYELVDELAFFSMHICRIVRAEAGFVTDYATVPRLPIVYTLVGGRGDAAAAIHDKLCRTGEYPWAVMAVIYKEALDAEGVPNYLGNMMYAGVRAWGFVRPIAQRVASLRK